MRGYVERMEALAFLMPEGQEPTHEEIMESYLQDADDARDEAEDK